MVKCLTVEQVVAGLIPATTRPITTSVAFQMARPLRHSHDYTKMAVLSLLGDVKILSPISSFMLKT